MPKKSSDALEILDRLDRDDPEMQELLHEARINAEIARLIYDARDEAGLSHGQLAKLVGTSESVISQLEDANFEGNSLTMLQKIAAALDKRLEVRFIPTKAA